MTSQNQLLILMYHGFVRRPLKVENQCFLDEISFRDQMIHLKDSCDLLPLSQAVLRLRNHELCQPTVALTVDDGFQNNYQIAYPILEELGMPATIFPVTGLVDTSDTLWYCRLNDAIGKTDKRSLDWCGERYDLSDRPEKARSASLIEDSLKKCPPFEVPDRMQTICRQLEVEPNCDFEPDSPFGILNQKSIAEMAQSGLIEFGAHTHSHAILSLITPSERRREVERSIAKVETLTGKTCELFAYPNGRAQDYTEDIIGILRACGIRAAVTTESGNNNEATPLMELRRYGVGPNLNLEDFKRRCFAWFQAVEVPSLRNI